MHQKPLLRLLAHPFDLTEDAPDLLLAAQGPVKGDSETVGFVTDVHQDLQRMGIAVEEKRDGIVQPDDHLHPLRQTDDHQPVQNAEFRQGFARKLQLTFTSIDDNELRKVIRMFCKHP